MKHALGIAATTIIVLCSGLGTVSAQDTTPVYGSQLMTQQERMEYRTQMRALKTQGERNVFRLEHHKKMQERAKEQGVTLSDTPPAAGGGMGPGGGGGMGGGRGRQ